MIFPPIYKIGTLLGINKKGFLSAPVLVLIAVIIVVVGIAVYLYLHAASQKS
jgi:uncharacterized protein (UPF0333 family)